MLVVETVAGLGALFSAVTVHVVVPARATARLAGLGQRDRALLVLEGDRQVHVGFRRAANRTVPKY